MKQSNILLRWFKQVFMLLSLVLFTPKSMYAQLQTVDGVYQVGNAQDLVAFSTLVNGGQLKANAVLTADINMENVSLAPIGNKEMQYAGIFDGQGHTIRNLVINRPNEDCVGLFGIIADGAQIKNFVLDKTCSFMGKSYMGVVAGSLNGGSFLIDRVGSEATFTGSGVNVSGLYGVNMGSASHFTISNCYVSGVIKGNSESAALSGWAANGSIVNCYSIAEVSGADNNNTRTFVRGYPSTSNCYELNGDAAQKITLADAASGALAYWLNGAHDEVCFFQTLGEGGDSYPVLFNSKQVYLDCPDGITCEGKPISDNFTYTNNVVPRPDHNFEGGICTECGYVNPKAVTPVDGYYVINNGEELFWLATMINTTNNRMNVKLGADIDYTAYNTMIGDLGTRKYNAIFDGQGHAITIDMKKDDGSQNLALFGGVENAHIKDLRIKGKVTTNGQFAAGLVAQTFGTTLIENVESQVNIISHKQGDATNGGLIAVVQNETTVNNCLIGGTHSATNGADCCGGVVGWCSARINIHNMLIISDITVGTNGSDMVGRNNGNVNATEVYYTKAFGNTSKAKAITENELLDGSFAYKFGWGQTLSETGSLPSPVNPNKVYKLGSGYSNSYYPNLEIPTLSTPASPKFYYIRNSRSQRYVHYTGAQMTQVAEQVDHANMFYFVAAGEAENNFIPVTIHNAMAGGSSMNDFNTWGGNGTIWYLHLDPTMSTEGIYIGKTKEVNDYYSWWNDHGGSAVGAWNCDGGSIWQFVEVEEADAPELALITYNHILNDKVVKVEQAPVLIGQTLPSPSLPIFVEATQPTGVATETTTIDIQVQVVTPFEASTNFEEAKWYQIINKKTQRPRYLQYDGPDAAEYHMLEETSMKDAYLWSFYGNPYSGYTLMNLAAGKGKFLQIDNPANGAAPVMGDKATVWTLDKRDSQTFGLGANGFYINNFGGGENNVIKLWQQGSAQDLGSTLNVEEVDLTLRYQVNDATKTKIVSRNGLTILSTATELELTAYAGKVVVSAEPLTVSVCDYFANETFEITPTTTGNTMVITLPKEYKSSALLYVTVPAGMFLMDGEMPSEAQQLSYYVHGSNLIPDDALNRILQRYADRATGIENVEDNTRVNVYNLQGSMVKQSVNASVLKSLKKGLYIVDGKKLLVK